MSISEKKMIPLSIDKCEAFKPKREKENNIKFQKPILDLNLLEEDDEQLLKIRDIPRRKSSTGSTSVSKPEDPSEFSFPSTPININQESPKSEIFFGRDRNCLNPVFNFYQSTEEHLRETYPDNEKYKNTKNYKSKNEYFQNKEAYEPKTVLIAENNNQLNNNIDNSTQNNNTIKNTFQTTPVAAVMGAFTPKICSGGKGKFDLPMYYVGFYGWDGKFIIIN